MEHLRIWVHAVWGTRHPHLKLVNGQAEIFLSELKDNTLKKGIGIGEVYFLDDHIHCLVRLPGDLSLESAVKVIKAESARLLNSYKLDTKRFTWAKEYYAGSVSPGNLQPVKQYILHQEKLHATRSFGEEIAVSFSEDTKD